MPCQILSANNPKHIQHAASMILDSKIIAFPTETVYGLAALASSQKAVQRVYEIKDRPLSKPLSLQVANAQLAHNMMVFDNAVQKDTFWRLANKFWPGPLTMVGYAGSQVKPAKIGIRIPDHPIALELLKLVNQPIIATSANLSGQPSPINAEQVLDQITDRIDALLDAGPCKVAVESTVVDITCSPLKILRPGAIVDQICSLH